MLSQEKRATAGKKREEKICLSHRGDFALNARNSHRRTIPAGRSRCGMANRGDSRGIRRVQRREVVLLELRCRIPARMHLLSRRWLFFAPQLATWATENGALRIPSALPLIASRSTPMLTCPPAGYIYGRSSARWDIHVRERWRPASRRTPFLSWHLRVRAVYNVTKFLPLDTCREEKGWISSRINIAINLGFDSLTH